MERPHVLSGWRGRALAYAVAAAAVGAATVARIALDPWLGDKDHVLPYFPAILLAAGLGGAGPGLLAVSLAAVAGWLTMASPDATDLVRLVLFVLSAAAVVWLARKLGEWRQRALTIEGAARAGDERATRLAHELELLIDGAVNYAIYMLDREGRVTIWNTGAERIKGWSEQEVLGQHFSIFYPKDEALAGKPTADLERAERDGRLDEESWRVRKDGTEFLASVTITALKNAQGVTLGFGKVIRDVTDERAVKAMIESREDQLRSILATVPDAMVVIDDVGTITSFSAAAEILFGWSEAEVAGRNIALLMPEPDRSAHDRYLARYLATGERRIIGTRRRVIGARRDGSTFPLELSIGEATGGGQRVFTGFIRDLSAEEESDARLRQMQAELTHVSRVSAMGTMASTLAHELNQPIAAVANYVEAARDMIGGSVAPDMVPVLKEALAEAANEAFRAGNIVRRLRSFVARGEVDTRVEPLSALIEEAAILGLAGAAERGISSRFELDEDAGPVLVDRVQIQQVLVNLMRNAIEAMAAQGGGTLTVAASRRDEQVHIVVADTGPGLSDAVRDRLFQAFASTKRDGMGLGLSICRTIIEAHGGRIWAAAREGGGTAFHFTVPRASSEEEHER
jgi:two-component system sensor kinase FixL